MSKYLPSLAFAAKVWGIVVADKLLGASDKIAATVSRAFAK